MEEQGIEISQVEEGDETQQKAKNLLDEQSFEREMDPKELAKLPQRNSAELLDDTINSTSQSTLDLSTVTTPSQAIKNLDIAKTHTVKEDEVKSPAHIKKISRKFGKKIKNFFTSKDPQIPSPQKQGEDGSQSSPDDTIVMDEEPQNSDFKLKAMSTNLNQSINSELPV